MVMKETEGGAYVHVWQCLEVSLGGRGVGEEGLYFAYGHVCTPPLYSGLQLSATGAPPDEEHLTFLPHVFPMGLLRTG